MAKHVLLLGCSPDVAVLAVIFQKVHLAALAVIGLVGRGGFESGPAAKRVDRSPTFLRRVFLLRRL